MRTEGLLAIQHDRNPHRVGLPHAPISTPTRADNIMWRVIVPGAALFTVLAAIGLRLIP